MKTIKGLLALGMGLALAACGGGGGGGDANVQISFTPAAVSITSLKGVAGSQVVTANITATGVTNSNLFIDGAGGEAVLADAELLSQSSTAVTLRLIARADLAVGTYRDELRLLLCRDPACASQYPGSPVRLPVTYEVQPTLEVASGLSAIRSTAEPLARLSTPLTLPTPGLPVQATVRALGGPTSLFTPSVVNGQLVVDLDYAPVGFYQGFIDLRSADGRYTATTVVSYQVTDGGNGNGFITVEEPSLGLNVAQGQTVTRTLTVLPPNWNPLPVEYAGASGSPDLLERTRVTPAGPGRFDLAFDARGLAPGVYFMSLGYRGIQGTTASQSVTINVGVNLTAEPSTVTLSSQSPAGPFAGSSAVSLVDGRSLTWTADPSTVPAWMTLTRASGLTGRDALTYTVDPSRLFTTTDRSAQVRVSVGDASINAALAAVQVDDRLPRLEAALNPLLELGQAASVLVRGHFPEDITVNGKLELFGASGSFSRLNDKLLFGNLRGLTADVPVQLRVRYPAFESTLSISVKGSTPATATQVFPLGFGSRRPPVYSARQQSFYFIADGAVQRLVNQGGTWVRQSAAAAQALDLDLSPDEGQLLVLSAAGIEARDAQTLAPVATLRSFAAGEVAEDIAGSRLKHIATTLDGQLFWATEGPRCDGRMFTVPLADPAGTATALALPCSNNTTSLAALLVNRSRRYLTLYQADSSKGPFFMDRATGATMQWQTGLGTASGIAASRWGDLSFIDNAGIWQGPTFGGSGNFFLGIPVPAAAIPAGLVAGGYGYREVASPYLAYAYVRATEGGTAVAQSPQLLVIRSSAVPTTRDLDVSLALPQAVGCQAGRPAGEPCDHTAHVLTDLSGRHALILGPQAAVVVPLPLQDSAFPQGVTRGSSILRSRSPATR